MEKNIDSTGGHFGHFNFYEFFETRKKILIIFLWKNIIFEPHTK